MLMSQHHSPFLPVHRVCVCLCLPAVQLAVFGIMASFDKALEVCQHQQQPAIGSDAANSLTVFWKQWHSYVPTGLLVAAAAAGQAVPGLVVTQADRGQWQGQWMQVMQQQELCSTLTAMAGLYDQVLEQQQEQQQHSCSNQQQQQVALSCGGRPGQAGYAHAHQQQQQQPQWWPQQQQQSCQQGWPPLCRQDMPAGPNTTRLPRSLPASLQPPPQGPTGQHPAAPAAGAASSIAGAVLNHSAPAPPGQGMQNPQGPDSNAPMRFVGRANRSLQNNQATGPAAGAGAGSSMARGAAAAAAGCVPGPGAGSIGGQGGATAAAAAAAAAGGGSRQAVPLKLQLSQSAQQPKRAAVMSAKAQLAAQKRSKAASGQPVRPLPPPAAESSDDDDFL